MSSDKPITKDTPIAEVIRICQGAGEIFDRYNMGCFVCVAVASETIEEGALMHDVDVQAIVDELNAACASDAE